MNETSKIVVCRYFTVWDKWFSIFYIHKMLEEMRAREDRSECYIFLKSVCVIEWSVVVSEEQL